MKLAALHGGLSQIPTDSLSLNQLNYLHEYKVPMFIWLFHYIRLHPPLMIN